MKFLYGFCERVGGTGGQCGERDNRIVARNGFMKCYSCCCAEGGGRNGPRQKQGNRLIQSSIVGICVCCRESTAIPSKYMQPNILDRAHVSAALPARNRPVQEGILQINSSEMKNRQNTAICSKNGIQLLDH